MMTEHTALRLALYCNRSLLAVVVLRTAIFENRAKQSATRDCQGVQKPSSSARLSRVGRLLLLVATPVSRLEHLNPSWG